MLCIIQIKWAERDNLKADGDESRWEMGQQYLIGQVGVLGLVRLLSGPASNHDYIFHLHLQGA